MHIKRIAIAAAIVSGTQAAPAPALIDLGINNWATSLDLPNLLGTGSGSLSGLLGGLGNGLASLLGFGTKTPDVNTLVKTLTGGLNTNLVNSLPVNSDPTSLLTALSGLTGGSALNPTSLLGKVSTLTGGVTDPATVLSQLTGGQSDLLSMLNGLKGTSTSPTGSLLSALNGASTATSPTTVLGKLTQAGQLLDLGNLITSLGLTNPLQSGQINNLNTSLGLVSGLLQAAVGQTNLPINANGLALPNIDQKGLCTTVKTLLQVEAALFKSLVQNNGVLASVPALQNLIGTLAQVQALTQTLVLQIVGLTPLCSVTQTENLNGLSGIFQNLLQSVKTIVPTASTGLLSTVNSLLKTLTNNNGLLIPLLLKSG